MHWIQEPARQIPVCCEADVCVVGGSCTGVFAAVRAARLGARVVLIERQNRFGGVAANGLVNIWHSLMDTGNTEQIIAGLTDEVLCRLRANDAVMAGRDAWSAHIFNPNELAIVLDDLVREHRIKPYLHTQYAALACDGDTITHVVVENKDGRSAIAARFFIDATGDGDLARDLHLPSYRSAQVQPPTACYFLQGEIDDVRLQQAVETYGGAYGLQPDWGWSETVPGLAHISMRADTHLKDLLCSRADDLTAAELEGRRRAGAMVRLLNRHTDGRYGLAALCSHVGVRETVHYQTRFQAREMDLLTGKRYEDAILNGTYRVDQHHSETGGITFRYLDGTTCTYFENGKKKVLGNWMQERQFTGRPARFYQVPFALLVQEHCANFICAGRMLHADEGAFGALRVMVNVNQLGEAAGVAAYLAVQTGLPVWKLPGRQVRDTLQAGGSCIK